MKKINTIAEMQSISNNLRNVNKTIALVPTMGYLHQGHLSLIIKARKLADIVVTSIFVNPAQFAPNEDYSDYPRDLNNDFKLLAAHNVDFVFIPEITEMYPDGFSTNIHISGITNYFEGKSRPRHFDGVALVVAKLFNIIKPHIAVFGQKDYQQCLLIKKLVIELNFDIELIIAPIVREPNGLAMSSRNSYLSDEIKNKAGIIFQSILKIKNLIEQGESNRNLLESTLLKCLLAQTEFKVDYASVVNAVTLEGTDKFKKGEQLVILVAVYAGKTRLIDNELAIVG